MWSKILMSWTQALYTSYHRQGINTLELELENHKWLKITDLVEDIAKSIVEETTTKTSEESSQSRPKKEEGDEGIKVISKEEKSEMFICRECGTKYDSKHGVRGNIAKKHWPKF